MLVFGVKYRLGLLPQAHRLHIHSMVGKLVNDHGKGSVPVAVGGTKDHIHVLVSLSPSIAIADLVREIKSRSSRWINENRLTVGRFEWQAGYGAFSYSQSSREDVMRYVFNQEEHHRRMTFREELEWFLKRFEVACDPQTLPNDPI